VYEPFHAALSALRQEFDRAAQRYPNLFFEGFEAISAEEPWEKAWVESSHSGKRGREMEVLERRSGLVKHSGDK